MAADHMGENNFDMCLNIWEKFGYKEEKTVGDNWTTLPVQNNTFIMIDICYVRRIQVKPVKFVLEPET